MSILDCTALELGRKIKDGEITAVEATKAALQQIKAVEDQVHGFVSYDEESALKRAEEVQKGIEEGIYAGPLAGVPMAVKDNIVQKDIQQPAVPRFLRILCRRILRRQWKIS